MDIMDFLICGIESCNIESLQPYVMIGICSEEISICIVEFVTIDSTLLFDVIDVDGEIPGVVC